MPENETTQDEQKPVAPKVETAEDRKQAAEADKRTAAAVQAAKEQAEQDEKDIEVFLAAVRGERAARGDGGSFDVDVFMADREAAKREADEKKD